MSSPAETLHPSQERKEMPVTGPIWLLSTKGRPELCQEVLDACSESGMTSQGLVYVDGDSYPDLQLPSNWEKVEGPEWGGIAAGMNIVMERHPSASAYGWLADDTFPRTSGWDRRVEQAAGDWRLAYCNDAGYIQHLTDVMTGRDLTSGLCWGGELVRAVGWWTLPGVYCAGIDTAWVEIVQPLGLWAYLDDVVVEHKNYRTGKREYDEIDDWDHSGKNHIEEDIAIRDAWHARGEHALAQNRILDRVEWHQANARNGGADAEWHRSCFASFPV